MSEQPQLGGPVGWMLRHPKAVSNASIVGACAFLVLSIVYRSSGGDIAFWSTMLGVTVLTRILWPYTMGSRARKGSRKTLAAVLVLSMGLVAIFAEALWLMLR